MMENMLNEARAAVAKAAEKAKPAVENLREKVEPVAEKLRDGAQEAVGKVKQTVREISNKLGDDANGPDVKNDFFTALEDEAAEMKRSAAQTADEMQKMLEKLMHGDQNQ